MPRITVAFARAVRTPGQASFFEHDFVSDIQRAIRPDDQITRYGRTWRFSQPVEQDGFLVGKLGYVQQLDAMRTAYDERLHDFVERTTSAEEVRYSRWVLQLDSQMLGFERRPGVIEMGSFVGAFRALLAFHSEFRLTVEPIVSAETFRQWQRQVDLIVRFRAVLRPPNPKWTDRTDKIKPLVDETAAGQVTLDLKSLPNAGLRIENTVLDELLDFQEEGYARVRAEGVQGQERRIYDSTRIVDARPAQVDSVENHQSVWGSIKDLLRRRQQ